MRRTRLAGSAGWSAETDREQKGRSRNRSLRGGPDFGVGYSSGKRFERRGGGFQCQGREPGRFWRKERGGPGQTLQYHL